MKSAGPKSRLNKGRRRRAAGQELSVGQNLEQQYQELLQLREKVSSLAKTAVDNRQQPKRKVAIEDVDLVSDAACRCSGNTEILEGLSHNQLLFNP
jgi:hypothetical protein